MKVVVRLAIRNLLRTRWRSWLTIAGIGLSTFIMVWTAAYTASFYDVMLRGSLDVELGHVQVQRRDYIERPTLGATWQWEEALQGQIRALPSVQGVAPRVRLSGLAKEGHRSFAVQIFGVDPVAEPGVTRMSEGVRQGRWFKGEGRGEAILGRGVSRALGVAVGDRIQVAVEGGGGALKNKEVEVVGVMEAGNATIDRRALLLSLSDGQELAGVGVEIHEAVISTADPRAASEVARQVQGLLTGSVGGEALQARPWQEVAPGLYGLILLGEEANYIIYLVIFFIVGLGVLNTLRMSAQERLQEFGVMLAVGLSRPKLFTMVVFEGVILGAAGAILGGIIGVGVNAYFGSRGLDLGAFMESDFTVMGVSFSERLYFVQTWPMILEPVVGLIFITALCALWPAFWSIRIDPRDGISGRR